MAKVNNTILALAILLVVISLFGTFTLLSNITFVNEPVEPASVKHGEVRVGVLPEPGRDAATGMVTLEILP